MKETVLHNVYAAVHEKSREFRDYLKEHRIEETSPERYMVLGEYDKNQATKRLLDLSQDMMIAFDVFASSVDPNARPIEFANQLGVFYIDGVRE